jgi:SPOR domain
MGPNSFRNLTYLAVLLVVGALVYLVYSSSKNKKRLNPGVENPSLSSYTDTLGSITGASTAALGIDSVKNSLDGQIAPISGAVAGAASSIASTAKGTASEVKEVLTETPNDGIASSEKPKVNVKSGKKAAVKAKPVAKFDAGNGTGAYMAIAGSFASKDNATGLVAQLKKMGFAKAEAVKLENSANIYVVAGNYEFQGGADAAVRTLKAHKVEAYAKKRSGEVFKIAPAPAPKPAPKPAGFKPT